MTAQASEPHALLVDVDGYVGGAQLGEREHGVDVVRMAGQHHGHAVAGPDADLREAVGEAVDGGVERAEGDDLVAEEAERRIAVVAAAALDEIAEAGAAHGGGAAPGSVTFQPPPRAL
jgi:hypothetical protein